MTNKTAQESAAAIKEEPPLAAPPVVSGAPAVKPEEKQEAAVSKEIPPVVNNIPGTEPAAIQKTEPQGQVAQPVVQPEPGKEIESAANKAPADNTKSSEPAVQTITSPDNPPIAAPETTEGAIDAEAAKTDAVKAAESAGTEKKADIELAASGEAATPAKDAIQVAAVAAPAGVVKDVTAPIEAQQQAENAKESAGAEKKMLKCLQQQKRLHLKKHRHLQLNLR